MGRGDNGGLARLDGGVPDPAVAAALRARGDQHVRLRRVARHPALHRARELARVPRVAAGVPVADGRGAGAGRAVLTPAARGHPVRRHEERDRRRRRSVRSPAALRRRRGHQVRRHLEPHARRHREPGLRPGGGRPGGPQPHRVRDLLPGAAAVLRRGDRRVPLRRELQPGELQQRRALLLAPRRPRAPPHGPVRRCELAHGHDDHGRRQAHGPARGRPQPRRARGRHGARDGPARPHDRAADELRRGAGLSGSAARRERGGRDRHGRGPQPRRVDRPVPAPERVRRCRGLPSPLPRGALPAFRVARPEPRGGDAAGDRRNPAVLGP